jgi:hypothetical protein
MKALIWHCKELDIKTGQKSEKVKIPTPFENDINETDCIVPWVTIESENDINYFSDFLKDLHFLSNKFKTKKIILTPFAHLTNRIASQQSSFDILNKLSNYLEENDFIVTKADFGSTKDIRFFSESDKHQVVFRDYPLTAFKLKL